MMKIVLFGFTLSALCLTAQSKLHEVKDISILKLHKSTIKSKNKPRLKNLTCQDTLRYAEAKEQVLSANPKYFFIDLYRSSNEEISMAYLSTFTSSISGVEIFARKSSNSPNERVVVQASIYSGTQSFEPKTLIGSATISLTDTTFNRYVVNFPQALNVEGNYCVVVKPISADGIIDLLTNDAKVDKHDEQFCRFKSDFYSSSSGQWIAIPSFSEFKVQPANFEPLVAPIVSYNLDAKINPVNQSICLGQTLALNSEIVPNGLNGNRFYSYYSFLSHFNKGEVDSTLRWKTDKSTISGEAFGNQTSVKYNSVGQNEIILIGALGLFTTCPFGKSLKISVNAPTIPTFAQVDTYCQNATPTALPATSSNGFKGTWNPSVISTATVDTIRYTFTPLADQCAATTSIKITVKSRETPTFIQVGPYCQNASVPELPTTSVNGFEGMWSAQMSTSSVGTKTYTFTPTSGQCAETTSMKITVNPLPTVTLATFNSVCDTASTFNLSGGNPTGGTYSGTSVINNSFNPSIGVGSYPITYSYTNSNGCNSSATKNLSVISCTSSDIIELIENGIVLYPNPTLDAVNVETTEDLIGKTFVIQDLSGRVLSIGKLAGNKTTIQVSTLSTGSYYVRLPESNQTLKFIKQ
jgi:hypothetical protein